MTDKIHIALFVSFLLLTGINSKAQSPGLINYQAVARNTETGAELSNTSIFIVMKILENNPEGNIVYQENHPDVETNSFGLFTVAIGGGEAISGSFEDIDWATGSYWLQVELDAGNGLEVLGSMQFVTVPYAFHAETVTNKNDADADPENELVDALEFNPGDNSLSLVQPGSTLTQDLSGLVNDADADPQNELVDDLIFDSNTNTLSLLQPGSTLTQNLSELIDDADADPENELVTGFEYNPEDFTLTLSQPGNVFTQNLSQLVDDADADPSNEAISSLQLSGTNLTIQEAENWTVDLSQLIDDADADSSNELVTNLELVHDTLLRLSEGENIRELNLAALKDDEDWVRNTNNSTESLSNLSDKVGIGTTDPKSNFEVNGSVGYRVKIINNLSSLSVTYAVSDSDHVVICKMLPLNFGEINIAMPNSAAYPGREITIRKTGLVLISPDVNIYFNDSIDYINQNMHLTENRETVSFISLGADGWTRLYQY